MKILKNFKENMWKYFQLRDILFYNVDAISSERTNERLKVFHSLIRGEQ